MLRRAESGRRDAAGVARAALAPVVWTVGFLLAGPGCSLLFPSGGDPVATSGPSTFETHPIRVNSVGYVSSREKLATVVLPDGMTELADITAEVHAASDGALVWPCDLQGPMTDPATKIVYYVADFTPFQEVGAYYVAAPGLTIGGQPARSTSFRIAPDVFADVLSRSMLGLYGQRCGAAVSLGLDGGHWSHAACHQNDAYLDYLTGQSVRAASTGGWHDAGDYGKYVSNGAFSVGTLLAAWEHFQPALAALSLPIPEHGTSAVPDFLAEAKWELDWLLTTEQSDGGAPHKLTALAFEGFVLPESDGQRRYFTPVSTPATADLVAVMAAAARIYAPYDAGAAAEYKAAAARGYQYLQDHPSEVFPPTDPNSGHICASASCAIVFTTGDYTDLDDSGERIWAAAEMFETTGDPAALADLENRIWDGTATPPALRFSVPSNFDWGDATDLGLFTYATSRQPGRNQAIVDALSAALVSVGDELVKQASAGAFGRAIAGYWWGSNGTVARSAMSLWVANLIHPDGKYVDAIAMQLDHLLGRNIYDRSQVTAVGYHPPLHPHHRPSVADNVAAPWPGLLVGGAQGPLATDWQDTDSSYMTNETAVNWISALVYAAAALTPPPPP